MNRMNENKKITVLPLGDSITAGGSSFVSYRKYLATIIKEQGLPFEFIGPLKDGISPHAGYGGKNSSYLLSIINNVYLDYPADIVLLHSGHNNFLEDDPIPEILRNTKAMISRILSINPDAYVLVAKVIPSGKLPKYAYIHELNIRIANMVRELSCKGINTVSVDHESGFNWRTDTIEDKVHPNDSGARKIAEKWLSSLVEFQRKCI